MDKDEEEKALIEAKWLRKEFINKMVIFGTIAIVVIIFSSIAGIMVASSYNKKIAREYVVKQDEIEDIEEEETAQDSELIPIYSDEAQNKINNIYHSEEGEEKTAYLTFDDRTI